MSPQLNLETAVEVYHFNAANKIHYKITKILNSSYLLCIKISYMISVVSTQYQLFKVCNIYIQHHIIKIATHILH